MNTSVNGLKFIAAREALVTVAYPDGHDADGNQKYSIGFGSQTPMPKPGDHIGVIEAFDRLKADLLTRDAVIGRIVTVSITQPQWDACASILYQRGSKALRAVADHFNAHEPIQAIREFLKWDSGADGVPTDGHFKRRLREAIMAMDGDYGQIDSFLLFGGNPKEVAAVRTPFPF